jgi:hypothetical protein
MPAAASDDDERPAYMIYIDPETGKYTTEDPHRIVADEKQGGMDSVTAGKASSAPLIIAGALLVMLATAYALKSNRR